MAAKEFESPPALTEAVKSAGEYDAEKQIDLEKADDSRETSSTPSPCPSEHEEDGRTIVSFAGDDDPQNPYNFGKAKKLYITIVGMVMVMNSTIGSSIASGAASEIARYFEIKNEMLLVLPVSIYLIGYVFGPLVFSVRPE